ncbi:hypothetical protein E2C01_010940 [Portunus trituberculatus]|uniref:Uncharacterized protein n=1 Tax=Portunus trituberculatus TaxID=210409 RepID=A0A5B7D9Y8_PORTR|nr:hypothetical protein [Portunus trituberculatus]
MSSVGVKVQPKTFTYTFKDAILYVLRGRKLVGESTQDEDALQFLYKNHEDLVLCPHLVLSTQAVMTDRALWSIIPSWYVHLSK